MKSAPFPEVHEYKINDGLPNDGDTVHPST